MSEHVDSNGTASVRGFTFTSGTRDLSDLWGLVLAYGLVTLGVGLLLAVWPGETLTVLTWLLAFQLLIAGSVRIFLALGSFTLHGAARWLVAGTGVLAVVVGVLCMMNPLRTLEVIAMIVGILWIVVGFADLASAFVAEARGERIWDIVKGVVSLAAGTFLVANPEASLAFLVLITCLWLVGYGLIVVVEAFRLRSARHARAT